MVIPESGEDGYVAEGKAQKRPLHELIRTEPEMSRTPSLTTFQICMLESGGKIKPP